MKAQQSPRVVLVTGAGRGLGRGIAIALAQGGYSVAINYAANATAAQETMQLCRRCALSDAQKFVPLQADISVGAERTRLVRECLTALGRIDSLVNNAGIAPKIRSDVLDVQEGSFEEVLRTNLQGPYFLTQEVVREWQRTSQDVMTADRKIVFVTSISANTASINRPEYCISKAGLSMAAQLWATRLARENIQVVEVRPGIMATDMTAGVKEKYDALLESGLVPQRRWGTAEDVGRTVRAVIDGLLPFSAGAIIPVDGGFQLRRL